MKNNKFLLILSIFSVLILSSCGYFIIDDSSEEPTDPTEEVDTPPVVEEPDDNGEEDNDELSQELSDWLPRLENVVYSYEGTGNEFATYAFNPQFNQDDYYQIVTNNGGTVLAEVFKYTEEEIVRTFRLAEVYYRDNFTSIGTTGDESADEVILKLPIEVGTSWSGAEAEYEITAVKQEIEVPAGNYETIEVTVSYTDSVSKRYYAKDVGLVYETHDMGDFTVESSLSTIQTDTPESLLLRVYVPDDEALGLDVVSSELVLPTNAPARTAIQEMLSGQNDNYSDINVLPEGTEINHLFKNDDGIIEVDVSSEFITNMNAGSTGEILFLASLSNTLLQYYGAEELLLTVDGEQYESGHILLEEGETIKFNYEIVNEE